jgi:hypothetical protein
MKVFYNYSLKGGWFLNTANNTFEKVSKRYIEHVPDGRLFKEVKPKKYRVLRTEAKEVLESLNRDLELKALEVEEVTEFAELEIIALIQPELANRKKGCKYILKPLECEFYSISKELYATQGFSKFKRGSVLRLEKGKWRKLFDKLPTTADDIALQKIEEQVGDNLLSWISELKYSERCNECVNICKQPEYFELIGCKIFKKKEEQNERKSRSTRGNRRSSGSTKQKPVQVRRSDTGKKRRSKRAV